MGAETRGLTAAIVALGKFQPAPPVGAETCLKVRLTLSRMISTRSARGGGDAEQARQAAQSVIISTHSARGGGDTTSEAWLTFEELFQPTPPVGAETPDPWCEREQRPISTHSARGGGDTERWGRDERSYKFQSTPPVGAETLSHSLSPPVLPYFNPLRPWGRRPGGGYMPGADENISIHSARGGGDDRDHGRNGGLADFNPLRSWGRRREIRLFGADRRNISIHSARGGGDQPSPRRPGKTT